MKLKRKPEWLRINLKEGRSFNNVTDLLRSHSLNTVCEEANCPNRMECFTKKTATFMILGSVCTRNCTFCNVTKSTVEQVDHDEPKRVADAVVSLGLKHAVITSVTRDDLVDGGASHFAEVIKEIRSRNKNITIEVLIPDLKGAINALKIVVDAKPDIINHNIETVKRLYPEVRPMAVYERSLELINNVKNLNPNIKTKSGIMLGLGENYDEVIKVFKDLREYNCDILTVGQYLAPSKEHHPVIDYIHPDIFDKYKKEALELGFTYVASSPLVRSSYNAEEALNC